LQYSVGPAGCPRLGRPNSAGAPALVRRPCVGGRAARFDPCQEATPVPSPSASTESQVDVGGGEPPTGKQTMNLPPGDLQETTNITKCQKGGGRAGVQEKRGEGWGGLIHGALPWACDT
jgi:hypothetical protein